MAQMYDNVMYVYVCYVIRRGEKSKLFVTFIGFSQAYDMVPRHIISSVATIRVWIDNVVCLSYHICIV